MTGRTDRPTSLLNIMHDIEDSYNDFNYTNKEALVLIHNHGISPELFYHPKTESSYKKYYDWSIEAGFSASLKMVEMFYTEHGVPISEDKQWMPSKYQMSKETDDNYKDVVKMGTDVLNLHRRREPRFYADIMSNGTLWYHKLNSSSTTYEAIDCNMLQGQMYGTSEKRYTSSVPQCLTGYYVKKFDNTSVGTYNYEL